MGTWELLLIAVALSMDAFAVSVTNGLCHKKIRLGWTLGIGLCFGLFQGVMPWIGYLLGKSFERYITAFDHYIALILLGFIGGKMLYEAIRHKEGEESCAVALTVSALLLQGVATSIDALAVGVSFAALQTVNIYAAAGCICAVTFAFSVVGVRIGKRFGTLLNNKAEIVGGLILIGIGLKIFITHMLGA